MRPSPTLLTLACCLVATIATADPRPPTPMDATAIRQALRTLGVSGSALYVGAHPDDENSAMIAWLSQGRRVRTAYLSLTRGDGGQDLIGPEVGERLGVIRTQELLDARRIDGGEQLFTRAVDFGFSKNPEETLAQWGHDAVLADVVWVIRRFQPDVIIDRFATDGSGGHGHHTASALLAEEAFDAAADATRFPEQLRWVRPWRTRRLFWNVSRGAQTGPDTTAGRLQVDLGAYNPELGVSYTEIAGLSRSMHKSQGVGAPQRRGPALNSLELHRGDRATADLFDGIDLGWTRFAGGAAIAPLLARAERTFDPEHPERLAPILFELRAAFAALPDAPIVARRRAQLDDLIRAATGVWIEATASRHAVTPGGAMRVAFSALARSTTPVRVTGITLLTGAAPADGGLPAAPRTLPWTIAANQGRTDTLALQVPEGLAPQGPYWLRKPASPGLFDVSDPTLIGTPEDVAPFRARFALEIDGHPITLETPVVYRWVDPVEGDRYRDVVVLPRAGLRFDRATYVFPDGAPRAVRVSAMATDQPLQGDLALALPAGWKAEPAAIHVTLRGGEADTTLTFHVTPGSAPAAATMGATLTTANGIERQQVVRIDHPHIPIQTLLPVVSARLVRAGIAHRGSSAGYVMGSGDAVDEALEQIGYRVQPLEDDDLERADLSRFDVIVIGVRAFNTRPRLRDRVPRLLDYVARGGRLVVQYQTPDRTLDNRLGPWPFTISGDRVTLEGAEMRALPGAGTLLRVPNAIGPADFAGWVQERGLSFANPADPRYARPLSSNDPGEPPKDGAVLFTRYGKGAFVYTGLAFFRQLPAGVPGAYRLWANLVSPERGR